MTLPEDFTRYATRLLGPAEADEFLHSLQTEAPVSLRWNPKADRLRPSGPTPVAWCDTGLYLDRRPAFTLDPLLHAGCYYVQEASSMYLEQALRRYAAGATVALDLCAAPGGKSTHARSLLPDDCLLVANEVVRPRSLVLAENLTKWGHPAVVVTNNDPADFAPLEDFFDLIVADVPCSGEGMFRKDPAAAAQWSPQAVENCRLRQRRILTDIWPSLHPGGLMVYSTCTYHTAENEENVLWASRELGADILPLDSPPAWGVTGSLLPGADVPVSRFLPHRTRGEGFFLAVLRKHGDAPRCQPARAASRKAKGRKGQTAAPSVPAKAVDAALEGWLASPADFRPAMPGTDICAFPARFAAELEALQAVLRVLGAGIPLATPRGNSLLPAHGLALSTALATDAFPRAETDLDTALAYLRHEAIALPAAPRGIVLLTYRDVPLGFAKNLGTRANNLYPAEWRIRTSHTEGANQAW